jgi:hypothetical protein
MRLFFACPESRNQSLYFGNLMKANGKNDDRRNVFPPKYTSLAAFAG